MYSTDRYNYVGVLLHTHTSISIMPVWAVLERHVHGLRIKKKKFIHVHMYRCMYMYVQKWNR